jgi:hypothetical protein
MMAEDRAVVKVARGLVAGIAAEFRPAVTVAFALATATLLYGYASHLVFDGVTEFVRARVAATLAD